MTPDRFSESGAEVRSPLPRAAFLALLLAVFLAWTPTPASAGSFGDLDVNKFKPVDEGKLANLRGGFSYAGMDISFGVIMRTAVNGITVLETAFNLEHPSDTTMSFTEGMDNFNIGDTTPSGLTLMQTAQGLVLARNGQYITHQMGEKGGGVVAAVANALANQVIQQSVTMNIGIQNLQTIAGLSTIGQMLHSLGVNSNGF
jgi:hypothetical protein